MNQLSLPIRFEAVAYFRHMKPRRADAALGIALLVCGFGYPCYRLDTESALMLVFLCVVGAIVTGLWNSGVTLYRVIAVLALPVVLLQFMLPKQLRSAVAALPNERVDKDPSPLSTEHLTERGMN